MIKTEITDNLCLVSINTCGGCTRAMNIIDAFLEEKGLFPVFLSGGDAFGKDDKIFVAVAGEEVFTLMNVLGSIRQDAGIRNYSINCSNSMVKWNGAKKGGAKVLSDVEFDIKLAVISENDGICFCDSAYGKKLCALLSASSSEAGFDCLS